MKHLRSKLEYTQTGLRTYMIIFSLAFTFSLASVPGEETGIDSVSVTGPGAVQPA